jgi:hypothetical protein
MRQGRRWIETVQVYCISKMVLILALLDVNCMTWVSHPISHSLGSLLHSRSLNKKGPPGRIFNFIKLIWNPILGTTINKENL